MPRAAKVLHTSSFQSLAYGYDLVGFKNFVAVDEYALRKTGEVYGIGFDETGKNETILKVTVKPAPLPCSWQSADIATSGAMGYAGVSGYTNKTFMITNYGSTLDGTSDSLHYTYGKFTGDGTIISRMDATAVSDNARAGVMMRESLAHNAKHVMMVISKNKGAFFGRRTSTGGSSTNSNVAGIKAPYT